MFQIVVDSGANLPAELVRHYNIHVLSFVNITDGKPLVCFTPDLTIEEERAKGKEYYDAIRNGMKVQTGLIGCGEFEECFRALSANGDDVLYLSISSGISGTFNASRIAANTIEQEYSADDAGNHPRVVTQIVRQTIVQFTNTYTVVDRDFGHLHLLLLS